MPYSVRKDTRSPAHHSIGTSSPRATRRLSQPIQRLPNDRVRTIMRSGIRFVSILLLACLLSILALTSTAALGSGVGHIRELSGDVSTSLYKAESHRARLGERVGSGVEMTNGGDSYAVMEFDDGQVIVLSSNSSFLVAPAGVTRQDAPIAQVARKDRIGLTGRIGQRGL